MAAAPLLPPALLADSHYDLAGLHGTTLHLQSTGDAGVQHSHFPTTARRMFRCGGLRYDLTVMSGDSLIKPGVRHRRPISLPLARALGG